MDMASHDDEMNLNNSEENFNDFLGSPEEFENNKKINRSNELITASTLEVEDEDEADYHVRAGRIGGETTKQRHRDSNFYKQIGSLGGATTMARHGQEYSERRKKGGLTTRARYGEEYYQAIAAKAARTKQDATRLRNEAIKALMAAGFKIPTIIKLTVKDLEENARLHALMGESAALQDYIQNRLETESDVELLFVSQSGKPLSLANTYTVMERHKG
jgi:hypothetical protein